MVLAQRLGGGRFAQSLAGLAVIVAPIFLAFSSLYTMNVFEPLIWTGCGLVIVHIVRSGDSRWWLLFGAIAGIGLENKHSMVFFGFATAVACIFTGNYGEAGAINLFGPSHGLPPAISGHQTHSMWGPGDCTGEVVIVLQIGADSLAEVFDSVEVAGNHFHPWGMAEENRDILVCRGLKMPLAELWPRLKHWN